VRQRVRAHLRQSFVRLVGGGVKWREWPGG
jgi:hypothetical protein